MSKVDDEGYCAGAVWCCILGLYVDRQFFVDKSIELNLYLTQCAYIQHHTKSNKIYPELNYIEHN